MSVTYEVDWKVDSDRRLIVTFDPATDEVYIDQYGDGWEGLKDWPDQAGTSVRVSIDMHPTDDDERAHARPSDCTQEIPPDGVKCPSCDGHGLIYVDGSGCNDTSCPFCGESGRLANPMEAAHVEAIMEAHDRWLNELGEPGDA